LKKKKRKKEEVALLTRVQGKKGEGRGNCSYLINF